MPSQSRTSRLRTLILGAALLLIPLILAQTSVAQTPPAQPDPETALILQVAKRENIPADRLSLLEMQEEQLPLTGRQLVRAKVLDERSGTIYSAVLDQSRVAVDLQQAQEQEWAAHEAQYNALAPDLYGQLQTMSDQETMTVAMWLKAENLTPPARPDVGHEMTMADAGNASSPVRDAAGGDSGEGGEAQEKPPETPAEDSTGAPDAGQEQQAAAIDAAEAANRRDLAQQVAALQAPVVDDLQAMGYQPTYTSATAPLLYVELPKTAILQMAKHPGVDTIYAPNENRDMMSNAKPAQKADVIDGWGFEGTGASVAILEDSRIEFDNPYLNMGGSSESDTVRVPSDSNVDAHATATGGMVASQHGTNEGIAQDVDLYSANATTYSDSNLSDAMDWAVGKGIDIINNSWGGNTGNDDLNVHDRHLDYIVRYEADTVVVAAGNEANTCGSQTDRVASPARGYNVISVGGFNDSNSTTWDDDSVYFCSSFVDPGTDVQKPEVAASGVNIVSTTDNSSDWIAGVGSGTSYAAPMVSGEAALLLDRDSALAAYPESVKAIIMATALHNIEGDTRLSDIDGAGGVDMRAAFHLVDEGWWDWDSFEETELPHTYTQYAHAGETVRAVIAWNSNPASDYSSDPLQADLDLRVYDSDGDFVTSSVSFDNSYEIVEFVAPETGYYDFRVSEFSFTGSIEYVGFAFWPGHRTLAAYDPASYDTPPVSRDYYRVGSGDQWNAAGLRMTSSHDYDLYLYDESAFGDPDDHAWLEDSTLGGDTLELVVIDGNHAPQKDYFLEAEAFSGSGGSYDIEWATHSTTADDGTYGPYTMTPSQVLRVWDAPIDSGEEKHIVARPLNGNIDLGLALFDTDVGDSGTWYQGRSQAVDVANSTGLDAEEKLVYTADHNDEYGLVAWNNNATLTSDFMLYVDSTPPTGAIHIDGALYWTNSTNVSLGINVGDAETSVVDMRFSNDNSTWSSWEPFASDKSWTLTGGDGQKTVYAQFRNNAGMTATISDTIVLETVPPTGSVQIEGGATYAASATVTLDLSASDADAGVDDMRFSNDGSSWSSWEAYASSTSWTLTSGDGSKTVYVQYRDYAGNVSATADDDITLDTTAPATDASSPNKTTDLSFTVDWSGNDATSGLDTFDVEYRVGSGGSWTDWLMNTTDTSATFGPQNPEPVQRGETYYFRVRAHDNAGNVSAYAGGDGDTSTMVEFHRVYAPIAIGP